MKKALTVVVLFVLFVSSAYAEDNSFKNYQLALSTTGATDSKDYDSYAIDENASKMYLYILANGGFMPYNSTDYDYTGYNFGLTIGGQLTRNFAMELGYSYSTVFNSSYFGINSNLNYNDFKLNFLYSQHLPISDTMSLVPYAGGGLLYSLATASVGGIEATKNDFGIILKGGLRYKYKILLVGVGVEYSLRIVETSTVGINFEVGVIF